MPGEVIAGKYRIEGVVGSGGMGIVVSAQHLQLGQKVAIKLLSVGALEEGRRDEAIARFLREGQAAARLTSDHVVRIYDVGTRDSGEPFMVMELLRGDDLATIVDRSGPAPVEAAVDYIIQACDAVGEAHAQGIVHRDLKPSNLFLSKRNDGRYTVKVLDFGISKAVGADNFEGSLTATRSVVGSPYYMSPEQVRDAKRVDTRTDIWSLGMILYELLVGEPAFNADTLPGICAAIAADAPRAIRTQRPDVPPEVEAIVLRCLEKDQTKRFQTVAELVKALLPYQPRPGSSTSVEYVTSSLLVPVPFNKASPSQRTVDQPGSPGTLVSPRHEQSGSRPAAAAAVVVLPSGRVTPASQKLSELESSATMISGRSGGGPTSSRSPMVLGALALALVAAGGLGVYVLTRPRDVPAKTAETRGPSRFSLSLESVPSGADVLEGDRVLGATPLSVTIDNAQVASAPKQLTLRLAGYEPYSVSQGVSESSVRVLATLTAVSKPDVPPLAASAPAAPVAAPRAARKPLATKPAPRPTGSDIRLER